MTTTRKSMRDEFEAYTRKTTLSNCERLADGDYLNHHIQHGWDIWQAATKKEREGAERSVHNLPCAVSDQGDAFEVETRTIARCAAAIRGRDTTN